MDCEPYKKCFEFIKQKNKVVTCSDKKPSTKYIYTNNSLDELSKYIVDKCLIDDDGSKCDFLLLNCSKKISYFIELKGSDLIMAVKQIDRSIDILYKDFKTFSVEARIVLTRVNTTDLKSSELIRLEKKLKKLNGKLIKHSRQLIETN